MASLTPALLAAALEEYYTPKEIMRLAYSEHPLLALLAKDTKWTGKEHVIPIQYTLPAGRSATFATAQTNSAAARYDAFKLTTVKDYGVIQIDTETIRASEGQPIRSYVAARKNEMDGILQQLGNNLAFAIYRNGGMARGRRGSVSGSTVTLTNAEDIKFFEKDMVIVASTADGTSGSLRSGSHTITDVNRDDGTYDFSGTITGFADNDYLFAEGDFGAGVKGLDAWVPGTAPGATAFFGVDRTSDVTRLGGIRYSDANPLPEKLKRACARAFREGVRLTHFFMNPLDWAELEVALDDKVRYDTIRTTDGVFGFDAITVATLAGKIPCIPDPDCQQGVAWGLRLDSWKFVSRGAAPGVLNPDGVGDFLRQASSDGVEGRFGWYGQLGCHAPGKNVRVSLT